VGIGMRRARVADLERSATAKQIAAIRRQWPGIVVILQALLSEEARPVRARKHAV